VEDGQRFETGGEGDFGERVRRGEEVAFGGGETGAKEEVGRGGVIMEAEKLERARGAETEAFDDGAGVGKGVGVGANFGDDGFDGFEDGIGAAGEVVGVAFLAGAEAGGAGGFAGGEEADVFELGFPGLAGREAVDAGGEDAEEEPAVAGGVAGEDTLIHRGGGEARGAERFHRGKLGGEWAGGNHWKEGRTVAKRASGDVRLSSVQFGPGGEPRLEAITEEERRRAPHGKGTGMELGFKVADGPRRKPFSHEDYRFYVTHASAGGCTASGALRAGAGGAGAVCAGVPGVCGFVSGGGARGEVAAVHPHGSGLCGCLRCDGGVAGAADGNAERDRACATACVHSRVSGMRPRMRAPCEHARALPGLRGDVSALPGAVQFPVGRDLFVGRRGRDDGADG